MGGGGRLFPDSPFLVPAVCLLPYFLATSPRLTGGPPPCPSLTCPSSLEHLDSALRSVLDPRSRAADGALPPFLPRPGRGASAHQAVDAGLCPPTAWALRCHNCSSTGGSTCSGPIECPRGAQACISQKISESLSPCSSPFCLLEAKRGRWDVKTSAGVGGAGQGSPGRGVVATSLPGRGVTHVTL